MLDCPFVWKCHEQLGFWSKADHHDCMYILLVVLWPWIWPNDLNLNLDIWNIFLHIKNGVSWSRLKIVRAWTVQMHTHTDVTEEYITTAAFTGGNNFEQLILFHDLLVDQFAESVCVSCTHSTSVTLWLRATKIWNDAFVRFLVYQLCTYHNTGRYCRPLCELIMF